MLFLAEKEQQSSRIRNPCTKTGTERQVAVGPCIKEDTVIDIGLGRAQRETYCSNAKAAFAKHCKRKYVFSA